MKPIYYLSLIPVLGVVGGVFVANRVTPYVIGLPFFIFWYVCCLLLTSGVVALIYKWDPANRGEENK
jgi:hypothetical protein